MAQRIDLDALRRAVESSDRDALVALYDDDAEPGSSTATARRAGRACCTDAPRSRTTSMTYAGAT